MSGIRVATLADLEGPINKNQNLYRAGRLPSYALPAHTPSLAGDTFTNSRPTLIDDAQDWFGNLQTASQTFCLLFQRLPGRRDVRIHTGAESPQKSVAIYAEALRRRHVVVDLNAKVSFPVTILSVYSGLPNEQPAYLRAVRWNYLANGSYHPATAIHCQAPRPKWGGLAPVARSTSIRSPGRSAARPSGRSGGGICHGDTGS
jgi:hypothetical protein